MTRIALPFWSKLLLERNLRGMRHDPRAESRTLCIARIPAFPCRRCAGVRASVRTRAIYGAHTYQCNAKNELARSLTASSEDSRLTEPKRNRTANSSVSLLQWDNVEATPHSKRLQLQPT